MKYLLILLVFVVGCDVSNARVAKKDRNTWVYCKGLNGLEDFRFNTDTLNVISGNRLQPLDILVEFTLDTGEIKRMYKRDEVNYSCNKERKGA